jgi:hypothetical protein
VEGEVRYRLSPLSLPGSGALAEVERSAAVALFAERARRAVPQFALTAAAAPLAARLVTRLDGMPLAIELAAGPVEREHEQLDEAFPEGMLRQQGLQFRGRPGVAAERDLQYQPLFRGGQPQLGQQCALGVGVGAGNARQRGPLPQSEGFAQQPGAGRVVVPVPGGVRRLHPPLECAQVKQHRVGLQPVAVARRLDELVAPTAGPRVQDAAQPRGIGADRARGGQGHPLTPQSADEALQCDLPAPREQQDRQHRPLLRRPELELGLPVPSPHWPENRESYVPRHRRLPRPAVAVLTACRPDFRRGQGMNDPFDFAG